MKNPDARTVESENIIDKEEIKIPGTVKAIETFAFEDCKSLKSIIYDATANECNEIPKNESRRLITPQITVARKDGSLTLK